MQTAQVPTAVNEDVTPNNTSGSSSNISNHVIVGENEGLDCDSDDLEALEEEAEAEDLNEEDLQRLLDEASLLYPEEVVANLLEELKQGGLVYFLQTHVIGKSEIEIKALFIAFGVLLPKSVRVDSVPPSFLISILKTVLVRHLRQRRKLDDYNTIDDAIRLIGQSKRIIVLSGR
jgi:NAD-dependent histone deacetylase SIR2